MTLILVCTGIQGLAYMVYIAIWGSSKYFNMRPRVAIIFVVTRHLVQSFFLFFCTIIVNTRCQIGAQFIFCPTVPRFVYSIWSGPLLSLFTFNGLNLSVGDTCRFMPSHSIFDFFKSALLKPV